MSSPTTNSSQPSPVHHTTPTEEIRTLLRHVEGKAREMTVNPAPLTRRGFVDYLRQKHGAIEEYLKSIERFFQAIEQCCQTSTPNSPPVEESVSS